MREDIYAKSTNDELASIEDRLARLVRWAEVDAQMSAESDAPHQARDDRRRASNIRKAIKLLEGSRR